MVYNKSKRIKIHRKRVKKLKLEDHIDVKVFILYLLNNIGEPLEFTTINDIVLQDEFVGYFDFALCFSELLESGQIKEAFLGDDGQTYVISDLGRESLESYEGSLFPMIKDKALRSALRLISYNRHGNRMVSTITEAHNGYNLHCGVVDKEKTLFSVDMFLSDRALAEKMKANFDERAEIIFRGSMALLSGDVNFIFED